VRRRREAERESQDWEQRYQASQAGLAALQAALLPADVPVLPGLCIGARYLLAEADTAAGGDWFDAVPRPDGRVALVVGDVVGHGIAASAVMGRLRAVLEEHLAAGDTIPDALGALDALAARVPGAAAATVCVALLDPASGELAYCTAGHPPPLLAGPDGWRYLAATGAGPLGSGTGFATATAQVTAGEVVLLYSDGLVERPGRTPAESTVELGETVERAVTDRGFAGATAHPADRVCEQTLELLTRSSGYADDITVLAATRVAAPAPLTLRRPATEGAIWSAAVELERWLSGADAGPDDLRAFRHAVTELVSNVVEHAYRHLPPGEVAVEAGLDRQGYATVTVSDGGRWRDPEESGRETAAAGHTRVRGFGLALVQDLVDDVTVDHTGHGTTIRLRHRLSRPAPLLAEAPGGDTARDVPDLGDTLVIEEAGPDHLLVRGPLHLGTAAVLDARLLRDSRGGTRTLTLDLSGLTHLASAGVSVLQRARIAGAQRGTELRLVARPDSVAHHVLGLVALDHRTAPA
jgi:serine phosphatase RsbU (regulator of sigma subunit)/anti-sigma regulatory factor (Ser/Thr protein kinase)/anti-anti-sigma regulatory factor